MKIEKEETKKNFSLETVLENYDHLPVANCRQLLRQEIRKHKNFVLIGETGSGKTTCLPPLLLELRDEKKLQGGIAVTQPRRIAARSIAGHVSEMVGCELGDTIGYHVRFENQTSEDTDITFMTDGILLRKMQFDPLLSEYSIVMIDEAHEQTTNILLSLGLLKVINERRLRKGIEPLHIIVSSATIERNRFAEYIGGSDHENSVAIEGTMFPVEVYYEEHLPRDYDFTKGAAEKVKMILDNHLVGDILIFMPGKNEINCTLENISNLIDVSKVELLPLHAELNPEDQDKIFAPTPKRKIIVATNIAETSVTIDGVVHVIDSGLIKQNQFDPRSGTQHLVLIEHALSGLDQRRGRAGRTAPGFCYRLFSKESLRRRPQYQTSELLRSDLSQLVLIMRKVGLSLPEIQRFKFLDDPGADQLQYAINTITSLGGFDKQGNLTEIGEWLIELTLEPHLGRMILEALRPEINCVNEITIIASFLDGKNIFIRPVEKDLEAVADRAHDQFKHSGDSDMLVFLNIWNSYVDSGYSADWAKQNYLNEKALEEAKNVRLDLLSVLANHGINIDPKTRPVFKKDALGRAITAGLIGNLIQCVGHSTFHKLDGTKENISIHPSSIYANHIQPSGALLVSSEIFLNPQDRAFACNCLDVKLEWLRDIAPLLYYRAKKNLHARPKNSRDSRHSRSNHHRR